MEKQIKGTILEQRGTVSLQIADEVADDNIRRKNLVYGASELLLKRTQEMIQANKTTEKINVGDGVQQFEARELNAKDYKDLADTIDKSSVTLKVNERFSSNQVQVNNQNNQISEIIISEA